MSIKITIPNTSSDTLTFGSANTPTAAQVAGIDSGSSNGQLAIYTTASGTSTERVRVDSSGNVGIGTSSPSYKLDILTGGGGVYAAQFGNGTAAQGMRIVTGMDSTSSGITTGGGTRLIQFDGTNNVTQFYTNASERMRIDSSGRLVVGANSSSGGSASDTFIEVRKTGDSFIATQGGAYGTDKQGFVYRRNGTYGAMSFATGGVSIATYSFNQNDDWYWYKWDGSTATSAVRMTIGGAMILRSTLTQNGSPDYAEYFEWSDGNPNAEDRKGKTVVMDGVTGKIRLATSTDPASSIIGVCSRTYGVILDSQELDWADKYLKNEFGEFIKEEVDYVEYVESNGNIRSRLLADGDIPEDATSIRYFTSLNNVVNPNFDSNTEYTPRSKRKEWEPIGLVGKLRIIKGQPVGDRWIKMRDISETVEEWLVR